MPTQLSDTIFLERRRRRTRNLIAALAAAAAVVSGAAFAEQQCSTPSGPMRSRILDAVRAPVAIDLGAPIEFKVERARQCGPFVFVLATPQRPGGAEIHWKGTPCEGDTSHLVGALLRRKGDLWTLVNYALCPADVAWVDWPEKYKAPAILFEE